VAAATTIVNAKVFDETKSRDWTSIRFADGLITECPAVSAAREGDEVIDVGGGTVLPGLIDAHVHLAPGGHPSLMYAPFPTLTGADEAEQSVAERIAEGSDYLKIFPGIGGRWPSLDSETITALVTAAHARGLVVVAHVSSTAGVEEVVSAGVDVMAHVPADTVLGEALVGRIADAR
jgi:imidazolonepropionase-like amidohydrolase